jgi:phosphoribosylformylglycinamidine cyclo-ligase
LARVLPHHCDAVVDRSTWDVPRIFAEIQAAGAVADEEMAHVCNLGLGMLAVVAPGSELAAVDAVRSAGHDAWVVGEIVAGHGRVHVG